MPTAFNNPRILEVGDGEWELADALTFRLRIGDGTIVVDVPAGFVTNFASTPRALWSIFPPFGRHQRAATLHDYLYSQPGDCSRFLADALFREAMKEQGVPAWRRVVMYYAVRVFGRQFWRGKA